MITGENVCTVLLSDTIWTLASRARPGVKIFEEPHCLISELYYHLIEDDDSSIISLYEKYYPPDFDPAKIPRLRLSKERQYTVRLMAPCNMRCTTCGEYIYKGKKFNARKETVQGEEYLGILIFRFYIKCTRCLAEITFKTDPRNTDYDIEHGATRNFQALKMAEEQAEKAEVEREEDEKNNPMKVLENRTKTSKYEMDVLESLEELQELNERHLSVNHETMIKKYADLEEQMKQKQEDEDEKHIQEIFGKSSNEVIKRLDDVESDEEVDNTTNETSYLKRPSSSLLTEKKTIEVTKKPKLESTQEKKKNILSGLVRLKKKCDSEKLNDASSKKGENLSKESETPQIVNKTTAFGLLGDYDSSSSSE
ncbi:Coiled-coil domain-containing protein 94 [Nymphon striatum]|nr:Coiled-coil domain-containing protein 94 [Nymphon striatum]